MCAKQQLAQNAPSSAWRLVSQVEYGRAVPRRPRRGEDAAMAVARIVGLPAKRACTYSIPASVSATHSGCLERFS